MPETVTSETVPMPNRMPSTLLRRSKWLALLFFGSLVLLSLTLWHGSILFLNFRQREVSQQNSLQTIDRLVNYLEDRVAGLRHLAQFCAYNAEMEPSEFQGFSTALLSDTPGLLAVCRLDLRGNLFGIAPQNLLSQFQTDAILNDPKLKLACERALASMQPCITETMSLPGQGEGFMLVAPIMIGRRATGLVLGMFNYRDLLQAMLQPELLQNYRLIIEHAGRPIYPMLGEPRTGPGNIQPGTRPLEVRQAIYLGGQEWLIVMEPLRSVKVSPVNFVSLTILTLGLTLSILLSLVAYRYLKHSTLLQIEARDNRQRLVDTGTSLVEIKAELDLILNSVDEGIILYDPNLAPVQVNTAFLTMFGLSESGLGEALKDQHHGQMVRLTGSDSRYWSLFKSLQQHPEQIWTDELEINEWDNNRPTRRTFLRRATAISGADGERRGLLVIYKEVSTMKQIERAKDDFLANVTHELRSPLSAIKGFAETLRRDPNVPAATQSEFIGIICEEAGRLQTLIEELLDLRRLEAHGVPLKFAVYDLRVLVQEVAKSAKSMLLSKGINLRMEWTDDLECKLRGDVSQISRALRNLLVNAIKYSPERGEIVLRGKCGAKSAWVEVHDQGAGIAETDLPHIFDKFYRGHSQGKQKGTGLGLAIVKHIVELHGGHLGVRSEVGRGTTFHLELPRNFQPPSQALIQPTETQEPPVAVEA